MGKLIPRGKIQKYVGIEIEFVSKLDVPECARLLKEMKLNSFCDVTSDGSIDDDGGGNLNSHREDCDDYDEETLFGVELRVLSTERLLQSRLDAVHKFLNIAAYSVNESCGLHVHLDMRNRNFERSVLRLLKHQELFRLMVPLDRRDNNYCSPLKKELLYVNNKFTTDNVGRRDINVCAYNKHKTVEVRIHEGTLDMNEILNWTKYLVNVVDDKGEQIDTEYVTQRIKKCFSFC
jgi:Putative amidoligase enzyme